MSAVIAYQCAPVFLKNDVLRWGESTFRVIQVNQSYVFLFELEKNRGVPMPYESAELVSLLMDNVIDILEHHEYVVPPLSLSSRAGAKEEALARYELILPIVENDRYLDSYTRGPLVKKQIDVTGVSKVKLYRMLRNFWTYGQSIESLSTQYHNCGAPGKRRHLVDNKPGRKAKDGRKKSAIRGEQFVCWMNNAITVYYLAKKKDLTYSYRRFVTTCKAQVPGITDDEIPSIDSFRNIVKRYYSLNHVTQKRNGNNTYNKDNRSLSGSATASAWGPGARYEIDATVIDVHAVSEHDRSCVLRKPILYLVVDLATRYIVGYYIGFYSPSFRTATLALLSAVQDKTHLLKKYGISPEVCSHWPGVGLPASLLSDKAELFGLNGSHLADATNMIIENTGSGRSDAKGVVEKHLDIVQDAFSGDIAGKSTKASAKKAGAIDGRLTACLTLAEIEEIIISEIILRNNVHEMSGYDCEADMPDDMLLTPINVWNWGIENRTGFFENADEERIKIAVLPKATASVSTKGVKFNGLYYFSDELEKLGWFLRVRNNSTRPSSVEVLYDPMLVNQVHVIVPGSNALPVLCFLKPHSRAYVDCSFEEVKERLTIRTDTYKSYKVVGEDHKRKNEEKVIGILNNAIKEKKRAARKTAAQTRREIPENRRQARDEERLKIIDGFSPQQHESLDATYDRQLGAQDEFSNPELDALFNLDKDVKNETNGIDDE